MALNDFFAIDPTDKGSNTVKYEVQAGATTINPGEPVIQDSGNPSYVIAAADGASNADVSRARGSDVVAEPGFRDESTPRRVRIVPTR